MIDPNITEWPVIPIHDDAGEPDPWSASLRSPFSRLGNNNAKEGGGTKEAPYTIHSPRLSRWRVFHHPDGCEWAVEPKFGVRGDYLTVIALACWL
jgi:hypothetical protein